MAVKEHPPEEHPITCFYSAASGRGIEREEDWEKTHHSFFSYDPVELERARSTGGFDSIIDLRVWIKRNT